METPEADIVDLTVESVLPENPGATFSPKKGGTVAATARHRPGEEGETRAERFQRSLSVASAEESPPSRDPDLDSVDPDRDYVLRKVIGQGGFGEVWEAQQVALHRAVAVKRLRSDLREQLLPDGSDARAYVSDFRQEALTTASLDHPNIVPIYDIGFDDSGFPLLAMKLVRGRPWEMMIYTDFVEMSVADFLAKHVPILAAVAQAIAFAHSRGVIHRDIKASQVMVGEFGEVYLMDWGLAVRYDLERMTTPVEPGKVPVVVESATNPAGTVAYMAPEQTFRGATHLGPWTDVFLLGGTLYFLLTGRNPHEGADAKAVFYHAAYSTVEPPEVRNPKREMPQELSQLCQHAMARRPGDRLGSAREFHRALQDYLAGTGRRRESMAITESLATRLAKGGLSYDDFAECGAELAKSASLWDGNPALSGLRESLMRDYANAAVRNGDLVLARVQARQLPAGDTRRDLETQIEYAERRARTIRRQRVFALSATGVLMVMMLVGGIFSRREISRERDVADASRARAVAARDSAENLIKYMVIDLTDKLRAIGKTEIMYETGEKVQEYFEALPPEDRTLASEVRRTQALRQISYTHVSQGDVERQLEAAKEGVDIARRLMTEGNESVDEKAINLAEALIAYGDAMRSASRREEAIAIYREATGILRPYKEIDFRVEYVWGLLATSLIQRGSLEMRSNNLDEAVDCFEEALKIVREGPNKVPERPIWHRLGAVAAASLSFIEGARGNAERELELMEFAHGQTIERMRLEPLSPLAIREVATANGRMASLYERFGKFVEAEEAHRAEVTASEELCRIDPMNATWGRDLAIALASAGAYYHARGDLQSAEQSLDRSRAAIERLTNAGITSADYLDTLSGVYGYAAALSEERGNLAEAADYYTSATTILAGLVKQDPGNVSLRTRRATMLHSFANLIEATGQPREALGIARLIVEDARTIRNSDPTNQKLAADFAVYLGREAGLLETLGEFEEASAVASESVEIFESIAREGRGTPKQRSQTAILRTNLARMLYKQGDIAGAREVARRAVALHAEAAREIATPSTISGRANGLLLMGDLERAGGESGAAREAWEEGLNLIEPIAINTRDTTILFRYLQLLLRTDREEDARACAATLVEIGFRDPQFIEVLRENEFPVPADAPPNGG